MNKTYKIKSTKTTNYGNRVFTTEMEVNNIKSVIAYIFDVWYEARYHAYFTYDEAYNSLDRIDDRDIMTDDEIEQLELIQLAKQCNFSTHFILSDINNGRYELKNYNNFWLGDDYIEIEEVQ